MRLGWRGKEEKRRVGWKDKRREKRMKRRSENGGVNYREVERGRSKGGERGDGRRTESKIWREERQVKRGGGC